jgi:23S rRNA pseudouridine1911/1915/1917 synthase
MTVRRVPLPDGLAGLRADVAVARLFGLSRSAAAELVADGRVLVDGRARDKSDQLVPGALVEVELPDPPAATPPEPVPGLRVIYEDDDLLVLDKPPGVAAHPAAGWEGATVVGGLAAAGYLLSTSGAAEREGVVHRLDVGTSGLMVVARSDRAYRRLKGAFKARQVEKRYRALVQGHPDPLRGSIEAPIGRHPSAEYKFAVVSGGKPSVTHYDTVEAFRAASLLDVELETGRTHQIRVHMAAVHHPCVGDLLYGADPVLAERLGVDRQWLHAYLLRFRHPGTDRPVEFESALPDDLAGALRTLRAEG